MVQLTNHLGGRRELNRDLRLMTLKKLTVGKTCLMFTIVIRFKDLMTWSNSASGFFNFSIKLNKASLVLFAENHLSRSA
jgi:hypothetical protein